MMENLFKIIAITLLIIAPSLVFPQDVNRCDRGYIHYAQDGSFDSAADLKQRHSQQNECLYQLDQKSTDIDSRVTALEDDTTLTDRVTALEDDTTLTDRVTALEDDTTLTDRVTALESATPSTYDDMGIKSELMSLKRFAKDQSDSAKALGAATANAIPQGTGIKLGVGYASGQFGSAVGLKYNINDKINVTGSVGTTFSSDYNLGIGLEIGFGGGE